MASPALGVVDDLGVTKGINGSLHDISSDSMVVTRSSDDKGIMGIMGINGITACAVVIVSC